MPNPVDSETSYLVWMDTYIYASKCSTKYLWANLQTLLDLSFHNLREKKMKITSREQS